MTEQKIIGLVGLAGSGKDTAAEFLATKGYQRVAFADPLYREVADTFGVSVEFLGDRSFKESPREELALIHCADARFIEVCRKEDPEGSLAAFLMLPRSPRHIMQWWGTDYRRKLDDDSYWLNKVADVLRANPTTNYVITDVRFPNEADFVERIGGELARIRRQLIEQKAEFARKAAGAMSHPSETAMLHRHTKYTFVNEENEPDKLKDAILRTF